MCLTGKEQALHTGAFCVLNRISQRMLLSDVSGRSLFLFVFLSTSVVGVGGIFNSPPSHGCFVPESSRQGTYDNGCTLFLW